MFLWEADKTPGHSNCRLITAFCSPEDNPDNIALTAALMTSESADKPRPGLVHNTMALTNQNNSSSTTRQDTVVAHETVVDKTETLTAADLKV